MTHPQGIVCPLLTPFEPDGRIARDLWVGNAQRILDTGAHYLSPFGTTGEALSVGIAARMKALDWLLEAGIPADRLLPGSGLTALGDTIALSSHAIAAGCAAVMVLPSFFYGGTGDAGQARYFTELVAGIDNKNTRIILYNIPQNSGVPISPALAASLSTANPDVFVAYKDSTGDWSNTRAVIDAAPRLSVFPGTEALLTQGLAHGGAGCISATVNLNAAAIRGVYDGAMAGRDVTAEDNAMQAFRATVQKAGLIGAMKSVLAVTSGDNRWLTLRAPHLDATLDQGHALLAALGGLGAHLKGTA
jgi:4-hydroxy-tetrahydrodipicolinate synthase